VVNADKNSFLKNNYFHLKFPSRKRNGYFFSYLIVCTSDNEIESYDDSKITCYNDLN